MEWTDEGIVLGVRRHGEAHVLAELMTASHGRHLGLVRGGVSHKLRPILQPGNGVRAVWRARLDQHLGAFAIEGTQLRAERLMTSAAAKLWHPDAGGAVAAPAGARFARKHLSRAGFGRRPSRSAGGRGGTDRAVRADAARGTRLRARSFGVRGDRRGGESHLCLPQNRDGQ